MTNADYFEPTIPRWLRRLGCFEFGREIRFRWGLEISPGWGLGADLCLFCDPVRYSLHLRTIYGNVFLRLPFRAKREPEEMMESWGAMAVWGHGALQLWLHWGSRYKLFEPLRARFYRCEILRADGTWRDRIDSKPPFTAPYDSSDEPLPDVHVERHPYHYMLDSGEVQHVEATVTVERREWRLFRWLPWPGKVRRSIDVRFSDEVGRERGSWKGGCVGCGYEMRRGESPLDTLRRMQRERRFR